MTVTTTTDRLDDIERRMQEFDARMSSVEDTAAFRVARLASLDHPERIGPPREAEPAFRVTQRPEPRDRRSRPLRRR